MDISRLHGIWHLLFAVLIIPFSVLIFAYISEPEVRQKTHAEYLDIQDKIFDIDTLKCYDESTDSTYYLRIDSGEEKILNILMMPPTDEGIYFEETPDEEDIVAPGVIFMDDIYTINRFSLDFIKEYSDLLLNGTRRESYKKVGRCEISDSLLGIKTRLDINLERKRKI